MRRSRAKCARCTLETTCQRQSYTTTSSSILTPSFIWISIEHGSSMGIRTRFLLPSYWLCIATIFSRQSWTSTSTSTALFASPRGTCRYCCNSNSSISTSPMAFKPLSSHMRSSGKPSPAWACFCRRSSLRRLLRGDLDAKLPDLLAAGRMLRSCFLTEELKPANYAHSSAKGMSMAMIRGNIESSCDDTDESERERKGRCWSGCIWHRRAVAKIRSRRRRRSKRAGGPLRLTVSSYTARDEPNTATNAMIHSVVLKNVTTVIAD